MENDSSLILKNIIKILLYLLFIAIVIVSTNNVGKLVVSSIPGNGAGMSNDQLILCISMMILYFSTIPTITNHVLKIIKGVEAICQKREKGQK